jgi:hypothetical protein
MAPDYVVLARRLGYLQLQAIAREVGDDIEAGHPAVAHLVRIAHGREEWRAARRPWPPVVDLAHWRQVDSVNLLHAVASERP